MKRGYLSPFQQRKGEKPKKLIYHITKKGADYYKELLERVSRQSFNIYFDFNTVIMNLDNVSKSEGVTLIQNIKTNLVQWKEGLRLTLKADEQIPFVGRTIIDQHLRLVDALIKWISELEEVYDRKYRLIVRSKKKFFKSGGSSG